MTDDEFLEFVEKKALPELERHVLFKSKSALSRQHIQDVVQETLIRFMRRRFSLPPAPIPWLKRVANNIIIDLHRDPYTRRSVPLDQSSPDPADPGLSQDDIIIADEAEQALRQAFRSALLQLTPRQMQVLEQHFSGKTHEQIAEDLDIPATTVAHYIRVAKAKLRKDPRVSAIYAKGK